MESFVFVQASVLLLWLLGVRILASVVLQRSGWRWGVPAVAGLVLLGAVALRALVATLL